MDLGLSKKVALVAASSTGLGYATARQLAREGASVAICSRSATGLAQAEARLAAEVGPDIDVAAFYQDGYCAGRYVAKCARNISIDIVG